MWDLQLPAWDLAFRAAAIYLAVLLVLRLFGKREVGQFTLMDPAKVEQRRRRRARIVRRI